MGEECAKQCEHENLTNQDDESTLRSTNPWEVDNNTWCATKK